MMTDTPYDELPEEFKTWVVEKALDDFTSDDWDSMNHSLYADSFFELKSSEPDNDIIFHFNDHKNQLNFNYHRLVMDEVNVISEGGSKEEKKRLLKKLTYTFEKAMEKLKCK